MSLGMNKAVINDEAEILHVSGFQQNIQKDEGSGKSVISLTIRTDIDGQPTQESLEDLMIDLAPYFEDESIESIKFYNGENIKIYESQVFEKIKNISANSFINGNDLMVEQQLSFEYILPQE